MIITCTCTYSTLVPVPAMGWKMYLSQDYPHPHQSGWSEQVLEHPHRNKYLWNGALVSSGHLNGMYEHSIVYICSEPTVLMTTVNSK